MANYSDLKNLQKLPDKVLNKDNYADHALERLSYFDDPKYKNKKITSSKLRSLYSMLCDIIQDEKDKNSTEVSGECLSSLKLLKVRIIYDMGRDEAVKLFMENTYLIAYICKIEETKKREDFDLFCKYFEALVAFHRYLNPKEN